MAAVGDKDRYRVVVSTPDGDAQVGDTYDYEDRAREAVASARESAVPHDTPVRARSLPIDEPIRDVDPLAEHLALGDEARVQVLVVSEVAGEGEDVPAGTPTAHEWQDVDAGADEGGEF